MSDAVTDTSAAGFVVTLLPPLIFASVVETIVFAEPAPAPEAATPAPAPPPTEPLPANVQASIEPLLVALTVTFAAAVPIVELTISALVRWVPLMPISLTATDTPTASPSPAPLPTPMAAE